MQLLSTWYRPKKKEKKHWIYEQIYFVFVLFFVTTDSSHIYRAFWLVFIRFFNIDDDSGYLFLLEVNETHCIIITNIFRLWILWKFKAWFGFLIPFTKIGQVSVIRVFVSWIRKKWDSFQQGFYDLATFEINQNQFVYFEQNVDQSNSNHLCKRALNNLNVFIE